MIVGLGVATNERGDLVVGDLIGIGITGPEEVAGIIAVRLEIQLVEKRRGTSDAKGQTDSADL